MHIALTFDGQTQAHDGRKDGGERGYRQASAGICKMIVLPTYEAVIENMRGES